MICQPYWTKLFESFASPTTAEMALSTITNLLIIATSTLIMVPIYYIQHPFFEQYKVQSEKSWPWLDSDSDKSRRSSSQFWKLNIRSIQYTLFNGCILTPLLVYTKIQTLTCLKSYGIYNYQPMIFTSHYETWPTLYEIIYQNISLTIIHELGFYITHRAMHTYPKLYKYHKVHHEYKMNTILASQHNHPIDFVLSLGIPVLLAFVIVRPSHSFILFQWTIYLVGANVDDHIGYSFPWSPIRWFPLSAETMEHEFHHAKNLGCFGSKLDIYNKLLGGYDHYKVWKRQRLMSRSGCTEMKATTRSSGMISVGMNSKQH